MKTIKIRINCSQAELATVQGDFNRVLNQQDATHSMQDGGVSLSFEEHMPHCIGDTTFIICIHIFSALIYEQLIRPGLAKLKQMYELEVTEDPFVSSTNATPLDILGNPASSVVKEKPTSVSQTQNESTKNREQAAD